MEAVKGVNQNQFYSLNHEIEKIDVKEKTFETISTENEKKLQTTPDKQQALMSKLVKWDRSVQIPVNGVEDFFKGQVVGKKTLSEIQGNNEQSIHIDDDDEEEEFEPDDIEACPCCIKIREAPNSISLDRFQYHAFITNRVNAKTHLLTLFVKRAIDLFDRQLSVSEIKKYFLSCQPIFSTKNGPSNELPVIASVNTSSTPEFHELETERSQEELIISKPIENSSSCYGNVYQIMKNLARSIYNFVMSHLLFLRKKFMA